MRIAFIPVIAFTLALLAATTPPVRSADQPLAGLIEAVLHGGPDSQLPANLAAVLGLAKNGQPVTVKQGVARNGATVRTINVRAADRDDVVLMVYDEQSRSMNAFLTSAAGRLRKAVAYQAGDPARERAIAGARNDFVREVAFWTEFQRHGAAPK